METLIMVPLQEEIALFRQAWTAYGLATADVTVGQLVAMRVLNLGLTVVPGGLGKVQFAIQTQHVLDVSRTWGVVICAGAAGALVDGLAVGDVVVATETVEHDIHNHFGPPLLPRFSGAVTIVESLRGVRLPRNAFTVRFGPIASGDEDIVAVERQEALRRQTGALAATWEGAGGARACQFSAVPFVEMRVVTEVVENARRSSHEDKANRCLSESAGRLHRVCRRVARRQYTGNKPGRGESQLARGNRLGLGSQSYAC
jgi:adenosylhomocysteine nucleosidase